MQCATTRSDTDEEARLRRFGEALDRIRARVESELGDEDVNYLHRMNNFSRAMEVVGRALIHFSLEPVGFTVGVAALWIHKQLQAAEIGHTVLHAAYDGFDRAEEFQSKSFRWDTPIDEESWRLGHNVRHHQYTNVAGRDPDIHFGQVRLTENTPHRLVHRVQLPVSLAAIFPSFTFVMNAHFTGLIDVYFGNGRAEEFDFIDDRSAKSVVRAHVRAFRKYVPYYSKNYLLFPALAGPFFAKVLLGNWLAEVLRDIYLAATIFCGHVGEEVAAYEEGTRAHSRGEWYKMQVEASNDYEVSWPISVLCGGLDLQIEHHLFPKLPPQRLREIAPEVRAVCEEHGVAYRTDSWPRTLMKALRRIGALSIPDALRASA